MCKKLDGLCFSLGDASLDDELIAIRQASELCDTIRIYSPAERYTDYALSCGLSVVRSAWIGRDGDANERSVNELLRVAWKYQPPLVIVGSEVLFRRDLTPDGLIRLIEYARTHLPPRTKVATAEVASFLLRYPEVIAACDVVGMHHYPFWDGIPIEKARRNFAATYEKVAARAGARPVVVFETGWPSGGGKHGKAVVSLANARRYFREIRAWSRQCGVRLFWFEAFNELWKRQFEGNAGIHWGLLSKPGDSPKFRI